MMHTNQKLLVYELLKRKVEIDVVDPEIELLIAKLGNHQEYLLDRTASNFPYNLVKITADKYLVKKILRKHGINSPEGKDFSISQLDKAIEYAHTLQYPVVVKPNWGSHGFGVYLDIENDNELKLAVQSMEVELGSKTAFIVEKQFVGKEYRIFITQDGRYASLHRDPASVMGDGESTIEKLALEETQRRASLRPNTCLCPILLNDTSESFLKKQGYDHKSIIDKGKKVYLRGASNVTLGGMCEDVTESIHPSYIEIAQKVLKLFWGLPYVGIDIMTSYISKPALDAYSVLEVNSNPGLSIHAYPGIGKSQNVASYVADLIFPETVKD